MDKNILDVSVIIKWFIKEEGSNQADLYLERLSREEIVIIIPQLLYYEVGNTLIFKKIQKDDSDEIAKKLYSLPLAEALECTFCQ
ncbi:type II toxin-antitoxin system VapC family toxin [Candidatus Daviesbacteria bacterium]|nr:type II toxin-antitoxin system VapC family toxin [Candidatus Daviesbacteria bacterium]